MAGRGPAPDRGRIRRATPARGEWTPSPDGGWQHDLPEPPPGISPAAADVWATWFRSWWAANWTPDDLPALRFVIRLWDRVNRGDVKRASELRQWLDGYGITPRGQQDRRWTKPAPPRKGWSGREPYPYAHLRVTDDTGTGARNGRRGPNPMDRFRTIEREHSRFEDLPGGGGDPEPEDEA